MEEWKEYKLGEITVMKNGKKRPQVEGRYPVYGGNGIMDYSNDFNSEKVIIVGRVGAYCGCVYKCDEKCWVSDNAIAVLPKDIVDYHFLFYLMSNLDFHHHHIGGAQPLMTQDIIGDFNINLPSLKVQQKIASILKSLDDKIEVNRRINENLEQQAQALFKSWFVDFEPFKNGEFVESELGMIPKGWRVGTLKEIADIIMGTSPSGSSYNTEGIGDVFYQGRAEFGFRFPKRNMYTTEAKRFAEVDTVLVSVRAPVGDINVAEERCCIGRGLASVKSKNNYNSYILYLMQSLKNVFDRFNGEGTVFGNINKKAFEEMQIIVPTGNVISKFDSIASSMDCQLKRTEQESRRLAELRDTLLPKLMSGELKVNEVEI